MIHGNSVKVRNDRYIFGINFSKIAHPIVWKGTLKIVSFFQTDKIKSILCECQARDIELSS